MVFMEIDYALLAEHAEVTGGKLYLMGGGWDTMNVPEVPATVRLTVALGVRVEWEETNLPISVVVVVQDEGEADLVRLDGQMQVGRPPQLPPGSTQLSQMTATLQVPLPRFGAYRVSVIAGGEGAARRRILPFRLVQARG